MSLSVIPLDIILLSTRRTHRLRLSERRSRFSFCGSLENIFIAKLIRPNLLRVPIEQSQLYHIDQPVRPVALLVTPLSRSAPACPGSSASSSSCVGSGTRSSPASQSDSAPPPPPRAGPASGTCCTGTPSPAPGSGACCTDSASSGSTLRGSN